MGLFRDLIGGAIETVTLPLDVVADALEGDFYHTSRKADKLIDRTEDIVEDVVTLDLL